MADENKDLLDELDELDGLDTTDSTSDSSTDGEDQSSEQDGQSSEESSIESEDEKDEVSADDEKKTDKEDKDNKETSDEKSGAAEGDKTEKEARETPGEEKSGEEVSREDKLLAEIERLSGIIDTNRTATVPKAEEKKKDEVIEKLAEDFIGELDMDDVASNPKVLNEILLSVVRKAVELSGQSNSEQIKNIIPLTVETHVKQYASSKEAIDEFYKDNPDLSNVRKVVKACAAQIVDENPEMKWANVLSKAAEKTRETLGIVKDTGKNGDRETGDLNDAAFANSSKHNRNIKKDNRTSQQKQIDEL